LQVIVRDNNVEQALKVLKKKMQREGIFRSKSHRSSVPVSKPKPCVVHASSPARSCNAKACCPCQRKSKSPSASAVELAAVALGSKFCEIEFEKAAARSAAFLFIYFLITTLLPLREKVAILLRMRGLLAVGLASTNRSSVLREGAQSTFSLKGRRGKCRCLIEGWTLKYAKNFPKNQNGVTLPPYLNPC
jgi:hypothetical protein